MWLQEVEDEPVTLGEISLPSAVEEEGLRVPQRRRNRDAHLVLDLVRAKPNVVEAAPFVRRREEVEKLQGTEVSALMLHAYGAVIDPNLPEHALVDDVGGVIERRRSGRCSEGALADVIELGVGDPVGFDRSVQLNEEVPVKDCRRRPLGPRRRNGAAAPRHSRKYRQGFQRYDE